MLRGAAVRAERPCRRHACRPHPRPLGGQQRPPAKSAAAASSLQRGQQRGSSPSGPRHGPVVDFRHRVTLRVLHSHGTRPHSLLISPGAPRGQPRLASTTPRRSRSGASGAPGPLTTPAPAGPTPPSPCPLWAPLSDLAPRGPPFLPPLRPPPAAPCGRRLLTTPAWRDGTAAAASTACERPPWTTAPSAPLSPLLSGTSGSLTDPACPAWVRMRLLPILWRPRRSPYPSPPCAARRLQCRLFRLRSPAGLVGRSSELLCPSPAARGWCGRRGRLLVPPAPPFSRSDPPPPPAARFSAPHCRLRPWLSPALVGRSFELMCPLVGCLVYRRR